MILKKSQHIKKQKKRRTQLPFVLQLDSKTWVVSSKTCGNYSDALVYEYSLHVIVITVMIFRIF